MIRFTEQASGVVDGVNTTFTTSTGYKAGSLRVYPNGLLDEASFDDGWVEIDLTTFSMKIAPQPDPIDPAFDTVIIVSYIPI